ncbi:hypothetical protein SAY87_025799 [Trapa incisa]|uniref:IBH1-like N-terminal domain-containing protein n=2 Tax=Trapa TaxID=22665 RepID=A0AAN7LQU6_TRANT|nr:hypothetical protein SAY87_025799 [Trapa incisa]KAK4785151.1 hypothetical protein SAY86_001840 [Trapa natans]
MTCCPSPRVDMMNRMASNASLKQKFLRKWMEGLGTYSSRKTLTTVTERKRIIKLSADIAMASIQEGATKWSRALIETASHDMGTSGDDPGVRLPAASVTKKIATRKIPKRRRRTRTREPPRPKRLQASSIAKRLVKKRTQVLKNLVPGGESMDDASLIKETLDYITSLQVQVDVMRSLACMSEHPIS